MHTLLTWLGNRDLENMEQEQNAAIVTLATKSPTSFDKIVILSNKDENKWHKFERFLKKRMAMINRPAQDIQVYKVNINSPIDYQTIATETESWITKLSEEADSLSINLTSGTPAMTTLSVLIGKGKANTQFIQATPKNELLQVEIPIDFGQEYLKSASKNIAHTATSLPKIEQAFSELTANSSIMKNVVEKAKRISASEVPAIMKNPDQVFRNDYLNKYANLPKFEFIVAPGKFFHDRYVISGFGAIKSGHGFSEGVEQGAQADNLSISLCGKEEADGTLQWVDTVIEEGKATTTVLHGG